MWRPLDFIGRFMPGWFDYAICDEAHQLANDTAQGNGLGTLAACADRTVILTGTLLGGYASDVYNLLYRLEAGKMVAHGYEWGEPGLRSFAEAYGVLERVTTIEPADNSCSKARITKQIKRRPGASPLLFSEFLMSLAAFVSLEDISAELPPFTEQVIGVRMDAPLQAAYQALEEQIRDAIKQHHMNHSVVSVGLNALLLYPDHPWGIGDLYGYEYDPETQRRERFLIAQPEDLDQGFVYAKERRLVETREGGTADGPPLLPRVRRLYPKARCHKATRNHSGAGRDPRRGAHFRCSSRKAGGMVCAEGSRGSSSYDQPSQNHRDGDRPTEPLQPDLL